MYHDSTMLVFSLNTACKTGMSPFIAVSYDVQWQIQTQVLTICHVLTFQLFFSWMLGPMQPCWREELQRSNVMQWSLYTLAPWDAGWPLSPIRRLTLYKIVARDLHAWHTLWLMIGHSNARICNNRAWTRFSYTLQYAGNVVCQRIVLSAKWPVNELVCGETFS